MASFILLDIGRPTEIEATVDQSGVWIDAAGVKAALGWELTPEGLCNDDVCIPVAGPPDLVSDGAVNLQALADLLTRPLALSVEEGGAYLGSPQNLYDRTVGVLEAPDFALPDLDGHFHSLSEHHGSKVLLAAWASW